MTGGSGSESQEMVGRKRELLRRSLVTFYSFIVLISLHLMIRRDKSNFSFYRSNFPFWKKKISKISKFQPFHVQPKQVLNFPFTVESAKYQ
jgi:hypothetical protein